MSTRFRVLLTALMALAFALAGWPAEAAKKDRRPARRASRQLMVRPGKIPGPAGFKTGKQTGTVRIPTPIVTPDPPEADAVPAVQDPAPVAKKNPQRTPGSARAAATGPADPVTETEQELSSPPFAPGAFSSAPPATPVVTGAPSSGSRAVKSGSAKKQRNRSAPPRRARTPKMRMR
jgi:hypothetical protein